MRNVITIAGKELRAFFASPMGWIVMGLFALLFGKPARDAPAIPSGSLAVTGLPPGASFHSSPPAWYRNSQKL